MFDKKLIQLIKEGNFENLNKFLESKANKFLGPNINNRDINGNSFLHIAAEKFKANFNEDQLKIINKLLSIGAELNKANKAGKTPFIIAAENGNLEIVKVLMSNDKEFTPTALTSKRALMHALENNHLEVANFLREKAITLESQDIKHFLGIDTSEKHSNEIQLIHAILTENTPKAMETIEKGIDKTFVDGRGKNLLMYAAEKGNIDVAHKLIQIGVSLHKTDKQGRNAIFYAAKNESPKTLEALIKQGGKANSVDTKGVTPLMYAARLGNDKVIHSLLLRIASPDISDVKGRTALIYAAKFGQAKALNELLQITKNVNHSDSFGRTALMYAAKAGDKKRELVEILLKRKDTEYVKSAIHLFDLNAFHGFGHTGVLLVNNNGTGNLYNYTFITGYDKSTRIGKALDTAYDFTVIALSRICDGHLLTRKINEKDVSRILYATTDEMRHLRKTEKDGFPEIYRYPHRVKASIDSDNEVDKAIRGANMRWFGEHLVRNITKYQIFYRNCTTIIENILDAGDLKAPKSIVPFGAYKEEEKFTRERPNWSLIAGFDKPKSHSISINIDSQIPY